MIIKIQNPLWIAYMDYIYIYIYKKIGIYVRLELKFLFNIAPINMMLIN